METIDASGATQTKWRLGKIHSILVVAENMLDAAAYLNRQQPVFVPEYAVLRGAVQTKSSSAVEMPPAKQMKSCE
jgi:hypothetical protein